MFIRAKAVVDGRILSYLQRKAWLHSKLILNHCNKMNKINFETVKDICATMLHGLAEASVLFRTGHDWKLLNWHGGRQDTFAYTTTIGKIKHKNIWAGRRSYVSQLSMAKHPTLTVGPYICFYLPISLVVSRWEMRLHVLPTYLRVILVLCTNSVHGMPFRNLNI